MPALYACLLRCNKAGSYNCTPPYGSHSCTSIIGAEGGGNIPMFGEVRKTRSGVQVLVPVGIGFGAPGGRNL